MRAGVYIAIQVVSRSIGRLAGSPIRRLISKTHPHAHTGVYRFAKSAGEPAKWRALPKQCTLLIFIQLPIILQNKRLAGLAHEHGVFLRLLADKWVFFA